MATSPFFFKSGWQLRYLKKLERNNTSQLFLDFPMFHFFRSSMGHVLLVIIPNYLFVDPYDSWNEERTELVDPFLDFPVYSCFHSSKDHLLFIIVPNLTFYCATTENYKVMEKDNLLSLFVFSLVLIAFIAQMVNYLYVITQFFMFLLHLIKKRRFLQCIIV